MGSVTAVEQNYSLCPGCNGRQSRLGIMETKVTNIDWSDAVMKLNISGIKMLHATDPELIDEPIDIYGTRAIHIAIRHRHHELLKYLLENGADVNVKGGEDANTALHEAVIIKDDVALRWLFMHNVNYQLINRHRKQALDICPRDFKRQYIKAKSLRNKNPKYDRNNHKKIILESTECDLTTLETSTTTTIGGIDIEETDSLKRFLKQRSDERIYYEMKKQEIEDRTVPITVFGKNVGIDMDEMAMIFQRITTKNKLWDAWIDEDIESINSQNDIYKICYGLTWLSLKKKYGISVKKPTKATTIYIKRMTRNLCNEYLPPNNKGKPTLTRTDFVDNFNSYLYKLHDDAMSD